jgi:large subunit ribosomal protein L10
LAITKARKDELVAQYVDLLNQSEAVFLTEYTGLDVKQMQALRLEVRKVDGTYRVTKNTLLKLALEESGMPIPADLMNGQIAAGFAKNEAPSLAKALTEFAKDEGMLVIKGGILGDELLSADQVDALAKLPSMDELRAQLLSLLQGPARNIAGTIAGSVRQVVNVVDAYSKIEGEAEPSA